MKILMLTWEYPPIKKGGIASHVHDLSRFLAKRGYEVHVLCPGKGEKEGDVHVHRIELPFAPDIISWSTNIARRMAKEAIRIKKEFGIDVIHAHDWMMVPSAVATKNALRLPLVFTLHSTENGRVGIHSPFSKMINDLEWLGTYEADRIITVGKDFKKEVISLFNVPEEKVVYIPNGIDPSKFRETRLERWKFAADWERIVFFVGRMTYQKGVEYLVWAMPEVLKENPDVKFVLAGKGPGLAYYRTLAEELGIREKAYFTGFVDDNTLMGLYSSAELTAIPSIYEPFGIVALETSLFRTPPVGSYVGGLKETIIHRKTGLHTYPANPKSIADQINILLDDGKLARKLGRNAKERAITDFHWKKIAAWTESVYWSV